jgi:hypothetical protein
MEYIGGQTKDELNNVEGTKLLQILRYFAEFKKDKPGPLAGGPCKGVMWENGIDFEPSSLADIEDFYDKSSKARARKARPDGLLLRLMPSGLITSQYHLVRRWYGRTYRLGVSGILSSNSRV